MRVSGSVPTHRWLAFVITDPHAAQERVWEGLGYDDSREAILHALNEGSVSASDRRVVFVGAEAYEAAGGTIVRDLFDEEDEGFLADAALLNRLVREKLEAQAEAVCAAGWKWIEAVPEFDHGLAADMRRIYPEPVALSDEDQTRLDELEAQYNELADGNAESEEDATELDRLEGEIAALTGAEHYRPEDIAPRAALAGSPPARSFP